ncbi:Inositol monophosphatase-like protein [Aduncisulcus paluster]|uniref:3'(2'),5'-bisphosphate nucleotidase 1 n=1 Tax=Aduncisulcus paluster TaxID=2918883 RepID=A0ABQ5KQZ1_9EUKA|nr:Inositol monophosphatase-like protein [Aduncisulcus paluster]
MDSTFDLVKLLKYLIPIILNAGDMIKIVAESGKLDTKTKGDDSPVTIADKTAQYIIASNIRKEYPDIHLVGEEGHVTKDIIPPWLEKKLVSSLVPFTPDGGSEFLVPTPYTDLSLGDGLKESDLVMFIDPLDATQAFVRGNYFGVSVLCGVATKDGVPLLGVTYFPFRGDIKDCLYYGGKAVGIAPYILKKRGFPTDYPPAAEKKELHTTSSSSHYDKYCEEMRVNLESKFHLEMIPMNGAGGKMMSILTGDADLYFYPKFGTSYWDTCGPQAILETMGGFVTNKFGTPLLYPVTEPMVTSNADGVLAFSSHELFEVLKEKEILIKE